MAEGTFIPFLIPLTTADVTPILAKRESQRRATEAAAAETPATKVIAVVGGLALGFATIYVFTK